MKCLECGVEFTQLSVTQRYCSRACGSRFRSKHKKEEIDALNPSVEFNCACCGKAVVTEVGSRDRRTRFCSAECEKKFWRHPHWENPECNSTLPLWKIKMRESYVD